jgi:hypothetical protein
MIKYVVIYSISLSSKTLLLAIKSSYRITGVTIDFFLLVELIKFDVILNLLLMHGDYFQLFLKECHSESNEGFLHCMVFCLGPTLLCLVSYGKYHQCFIQ